MVSIFQEALLVFGTIIAIANPISTAFVFNALVKRNRRDIATAAIITAFTVLVTFLFLGNHLLSFFGITIYAFQAAGGLYLAKVAFDMLGHSIRNATDVYNDAREIAIIPIAIPFISGPGAITSVLVMSSLYHFLAVLIAIVLMLAITWILLINAHKLERVLGQHGTAVIERILGLIVLVISIQFIFNGVSGFIEIL